MNKKIYGIVFYYGEGFERYKKYKFYSTQKEQKKAFKKYRVKILEWSFSL